MSIVVEIPTSLRAECDGATRLEIAASSVRTALAGLARSHPGLYRSVCDETGATRRHVNLFVNDDLVPKENGLDSPLAAGDVLSIFPAVSGG